MGVCLRLTMIYFKTKGEKSMSKLHLLCELNDENYTLASFSFYENFQDAVQNAIKACKEWNEDCEVHAGKELRITANC